MRFLDRFFSHFLFVITSALNMDEDNLVLNQCRLGNVSFVKTAMKQFGSCAVLNARASVSLFREEYNYYFGEQSTCFLAASAFSKEKLVKFLLRENVDTDQKSLGDHNALHVVFLPYYYLALQRPPEYLIAASDSTLKVKLNIDNDERKDVFKLLLDACIDINAKNIKNATPLLLAIEVGKRELVRTLLERGADYEMMDAGYTPMFAAMMNRHTLLTEYYPYGMIEELVKWGAPIIEDFKEFAHMFEATDFSNPNLKPAYIGLTIDEYIELLNWEMKKNERVQAEIINGKKMRIELRGLNDSCASNPCFSCPDLFDAYDCTNASQTCNEKNPKDDKAEFCTNHGRCSKRNVCECDQDWSGINCETNATIPTIPAVTTVTTIDPDWSGTTIGTDIGTTIATTDPSYETNATIATIATITTIATIAAIVSIIVICAFCTGPKKVITGKNWASKIIFNFYGKDARIETILTDRVYVINAMVDGIYPKASDSSVVQICAYGSKMPLFPCLCCCRNVAHKIWRHVFVEARTTAKTVWTFEKVAKGIIVQVSEDRASPSVRVLQNGMKRGAMKKSIEDNDPKACTASDILDWIVCRELSKSYHIAESNCAFFAHNLFVKFANEPYPIEPRGLTYSKEPNPGVVAISEILHFDNAASRAEFAVNAHNSDETPENLENKTCSIRLSGPDSNSIDQNCLPTQKPPIIILTVAQIHPSSSTIP